jgi:hypothetical protein
MNTQPAIHNLLLVRLREKALAQLFVRPPGGLMLEAKPKNILSWDFSIFTAGEKIAELDLSWLREKARFMLGDTVYEIRRDSIVQGMFSLYSGDQIIAGARKASIFTRSFQVNYEGRSLELKALQIYFRKFGLFENNTRIGSISPAGWPGRKAIIDLPEELPPAVQLFLFCLVAFLWRRAEDSHAQASS